MTLYEAIYNRRSVRSFKMDRMSGEFFHQLDKYMETISPLYPDIRCHIDIVCTLDSNVFTKGFFKVKAPYLIVFRSEGNYEAHENAGYILEQIVLYLASKGIGSCYQGAANVSYDTEYPELVPCMVVAFGYTESNPHRDAINAKRKPLKSLCTLKSDYDIELMKLLEAARLAPSAVNSQPWRFVVYSNRIHVFAKTDSIIEKYSDMVSAVDMGIVQCHLMIAAEEQWMKAELKKLDSVSDKGIKNHKYIKTMIIQER